MRDVAFTVLLSSYMWDKDTSRQLGESRVEAGPWTGEKGNREPEPWLMLLISTLKLNTE